MWLFCCDLGTNLLPSLGLLCHHKVGSLKALLHVVIQWFCNLACFPSFSEGLLFLYIISSLLWLPMESPWSREQFSIPLWCPASEPGHQKILCFSPLLRSEKSFFGMKCTLATVLLFTCATGHWSVTTCYHQPLKLWLIPQLFTNVGQEGREGEQKPLGMELLGNSEGSASRRRTCLLLHRGQKEGVVPQSISLSRANCFLLSPPPLHVFISLGKLGRNLGLECFNNLWRLNQASGPYPTLVFLQVMFKIQ